MPAVRRSCQTIARRGERRDSRSHSDGGLALVGDPERGRRVGPGELFEDLADRGEGGRPDLLRVVLDPPVGGEVLLELRVPAGGHPRARVDGERRHAGGPGVEGQDAHRVAPALSPAGSRGHVSAQNLLAAATPSSLPSSREHVMAGAY